MENNEIMQRLLQDNKTTTVKDEQYEKRNDGDPSMSMVRIVTAKHKVYIILLLILILLFLIVWIPNSQDKYNTTDSTYNAVKNNLTTTENKIREAKEDMDYLCNENDWIIKNEEALRNCLNNEINCVLPEKWKTWSWNKLEDYDTKVPLSYLQIHSLYNKKMPVDEKRIIKNLDKYLNKEWFSWWWNNRIWDILKIDIWDPEIIWSWKKENSAGKSEEIPNFFSVTVDVEIEFKTVQDLINFLYNVEKQLFEGDKSSRWEVKKAGEDRILYKIQSVSYDIVTNDEPQVTDISMVAYYYFDERFNDEDDCGTPIQNTTENTTANEENNKWDESESFLDWIFNKFKN